MEEGRRDILKGILGVGAGLGLLENRTPNLQAAGHPLAAASDARSTVKDKLWIWGHPAGSHNTSWGLPGHSRMTPAEGAFYLGVPNMILVSYQDEKDPAKMLPEVSSYDQYAISFRPLKSVVWSMVGAGGVVNQRGVESSVTWPRNTLISSASRWMISSATRWTADGSVSLHRRSLRISATSSR